MKQSSEHAEQEGVTRRQLLKVAVLGIGGVITAAVAAPAVRYFVAPGLAKEQATWVPIARTTDIPTGKPYLVQYEERVQDAWVVSPETKTAWVLTLDGQKFVVYDPHCTHLGCAYFWSDKENKFLCPCHNGQFDINGNVVGGPPPRPLDRLDNQVQGSVIMVGKVIRSK